MMTRVKTRHGMAMTVMVTLLMTDSLMEIHGAAGREIWDYSTQKKITDALIDSVRWLKCHKGLILIAKWQEDLVRWL